MAHHPRGYEVIYGFDSLDLFHNMFPEMLYDAEAFPDPTVRWMRDRIASLMPTPYARQRTLYEVYSMAQRREWLQQWRNQHTTIPSIPQNTIHTNLAPSTIGGASGTASISTIGSSGTASISTIGATTVNMPLVSTIVGNASFRMDASHRNNTLQNDDVGGEVILPAVHPRSRNQTATVLASLLQQGLTPQNVLLNMLNRPDVVSELRDARQQLSRAWQDVTVIASNEVIEQGSRLLTNEEIHADEMCSVCQHHSEPDTETSTWRALYCGHSFHRDCIDQWFEQNVLCPVCRADIRDYPRDSSPLTPS